MNRAEFPHESECDGVGLRVSRAREVCRMAESFGARLRQRREQQQIALTTIAEQTKIKLSLLEALERDDLSRWPEGIFRRAFVRAYAHAVGLEPDVIVREFLDAYPDPVEADATVPASITAPGVDGAANGGGPPTRFHYLFGTAIDSLSRLGIVQKQRPAVEEPKGIDRTPVTPPVSFEPDVTAPVSREPEMTAPVSSEPDLLAAAHLCTELGRVEGTREAAPLLQEAARLLDAVGLIVWVWDPHGMELTPALAHGYSDRVLAQLPRVRRDADNATAAAFRSAEPCVVNGNTLTSGALVVPLMTPTGCGGVLAIELQHGSAQKASVRALVTIFAAQLARLVSVARPAEAVDRRLA
jgi:transcriptional regulator with XRE-family HTH domain